MYGLAAKKNGHCSEVAVVEAETRVNVWTACQKKNGRCSEVVVSGGSSVV